MKKYLFSLLFLFISSAAAQQNFWEQTNGPFGGTVTAIVVNDRGDILVGDYGLYLSTNGGKIWKHTMTYLDIVQFTVDRNKNMYAVEGVAGVLKSSDFGLSWTVIVKPDTLTGSGYLTSMLISNNDIFFIGTTNGNLYQSTNQGSTWNQIGAGLNQKTINCLNTDSTGNLFVGTVSGMFRSTDEGFNWTKVITPDSNIKSMRTLSDNKMIAAIDQSNRGIYISSDGGTFWSKIFPIIPTMSFTALIKNKQDDIFFGTQKHGCWRSTDEGITWDSLGFSFSILSLACDSFDNIYLGLDQKEGLYKSTHDGDTWHQIGVIDTRINILTENKLGVLYAAGGTGVYRTTTEGDSWMKSNIPVKINPSNISDMIVDDKGTIFVIIHGGEENLFQSLDDGASWKYIDAGIPRIAIQSFARDSSGNIYLGVGYLGVYRSSDGGKSWIVCNTSLTSSSAIKLFVTRMGNIVLLTIDSVFRSTNKGDSWSKIQTSFTESFEARIFSDRSGNLYIPTIYGAIYRSVDDGITWNKFTQVSTYSSIMGFVIANQSEYYALTRFGGIYRSTDQGTTWIKLNSGLEASFGYEHLFLSKSGRLFVGSNDAGVLRSVGTISSLNSRDYVQPLTSTLSQNYPNPFSDRTTISFAMRDYGLGNRENQNSSNDQTLISNPKSLITLKVFDLFGREVLDLSNEARTNSTFSIHHSQLPSPGVYFYRLSTAMFSETKIMCMLR